MMTRDELMPFCSGKDDLRLVLHQPWSRGEYTFATNGHILVRVARLPEVAENEEAPKAEPMFVKAAAAPENWMPVPVATMPPDESCPECHGAGVAECSMGFDHDCEWCDHTGKVKVRVGTPVGDASFDVGYLSLIQGWEISPNGKEPARIRNGEATGLLMPRSRP